MDIDMTKLEKIWDDIDNAPDDVWDNLQSMGLEDLGEMYDVPEWEAKISYSFTLLLLRTLQEFKF